MSNMMFEKEEKRSFNTMPAETNGEQLHSTKHNKYDDNASTEDEDETDDEDQHITYNKQIRKVLLDDAHDSHKEQSASINAPSGKHQSSNSSGSSKGRKKTCQNPNRKDKAGRTRIFSATTAGHLDKVKELVDCGADVNFRDNAGWTPLHEAALKGQFEIAKYLIDCGAQVNVRGFGLDTPLHDACSSNSSECIQLLIDAGADVFALNEAEKRPIDLCSDDECQAILEAKMKALDQLVARDERGRSSLHRASMTNDLEQMKHLLEQGADVNAKDNQQATPLHLAAALGNTESVRLLVEHGAVVNMIGTDYQDTPLHQASRQGHKETVRYLIKAGADVNSTDKEDRNPYQVCSASFPGIRQLLTARMDEVRLEKETTDALDEIAKKAQKTAIKDTKATERQLTREERKIQNYMRQFANMDKSVHSVMGVGGNGQNATGTDEEYSPLKLMTLPTKRRRKRRNTNASTASNQSRRSSPAADSDASTTNTNITSKRSTPVPKLDPFKKDTSGRTQLHKYAKKGDCKTVESLLDAGADAKAKDFAGWTPLHEAALNGHLDVCRTLLKHGADVNAKGADMDTPLHDATENNHCEIVELLLEHGADPFARNEHDAEPIDIATENEFEDIMLVLQNASPVVKKKRRRVLKAEDVDDSVSTISPPKTSRRRKRANVISDSDDDDDNFVKKETSEGSELNSTARLRRAHSRKRRLIQAADLEKCKDNDSVEETESIKQEDIIPEVNDHALMNELKTEEEVSIKQEKENVAIHLPYKKNGFSTSAALCSHNGLMKKSNGIHFSRSDAAVTTNSTASSPLYTVQLNTTYYVIDLQVAMFLKMSLDKFWSNYSYLSKNRKSIHAEGKARLWSTLKHTMHNEGKQSFVQRQLYFISLDDVLALVKKDFDHLSSSLITITLDIGYYKDDDDESKEDDVTKQKKKAQEEATMKYNLPPKLAMKLKMKKLHL